jgi:hypothetical protein
MKRSAKIWLLLPTVWAILVLLFCGIARSAEWKFGVSSGVCYDKGTWGPGTAKTEADGVTPIPTHSDQGFPPYVSAQVSTDAIKWPWGLKTMFKIEYKRLHFDFNDGQTPIMRITPSHYSFFVGLEKTFKKSDIELHLAGGIAYRPSVNLKMYQVGVGWHRRDESTVYPVVEFGIDKLFTPAQIEQGIGDAINFTFKNLGIKKTFDFTTTPDANFKIGPELGVDWYPKAEGVNWCRKGRTNNFVPYMGIIVKF